MSLRAKLEIVAVIVTGLFHVVLIEVFNARALFIGLSIAAWTFYIGSRIWTDPRALSVWGFQRGGLGDRRCAPS